MLRGDRFVKKKANICHYACREKRKKRYVFA